MRIFVDSGGWLGLVYQSDQHHRRALAEYRRLQSAKAHLVTSNYVVAETTTRLRYRVGLHAARAFRERMLAMRRIRQLEIIWVDELIEFEAWQVLEQYSQLELSLTDATSAVIARQQRADHVFGFDSDFTVLGFSLLPVL